MKLKELVAQSPKLARLFDEIQIGRVRLRQVDDKPVKINLATMYDKINESDDIVQIQELCFEPISVANTKIYKLTVTDKAANMYVFTLKMIPEVLTTKDRGILLVERLRQYWPEFAKQFAIHFQLTDKREEHAYVCFETVTVAPSEFCDNPKEVDSPLAHAARFFRDLIALIINSAKRGICLTDIKASNFAYHDGVLMLVDTKSVYALQANLDADKTIKPELVHAELAQAERFASEKEVLRYTLHCGVITCISIVYGQEQLPNEMHEQLRAGNIPDIITDRKLRDILSAYLYCNNEELAQGLVNHSWVNQLQDIVLGVAKNTSLINNEVFGRVNAYIYGVPIQINELRHYLIFLKAAFDDDESLVDFCKRVLEHIKAPTFQIETLTDEQFKTQMVFLLDNDTTFNGEKIAKRKQRALAYLREVVKDIQPERLDMVEKLFKPGSRCPTLLAAMNRSLSQPDIDFRLEFAETIGSARRAKKP